MTWRACENRTMACVTPEEARELVAANVAVGRWMDEANNVIGYYRKLK
ncbi:hypothetical protein [Amorphus sp. MBR-141]